MGSGSGPYEIHERALGAWVPALRRIRAFVRSSIEAGRAMTRFYLPASSAEDWRQGLADPDKHWRTGYSARALAYAWSESSGFPVEVRDVLDASAETGLHHLELLAAFPEHKVPLPGGRRSSQNDIWVLAKGVAGLVSIAVEGKVSKPFDKPVAEWLTNASPGKRERLEYLCATLGLDTEQVQGIRYQLLHRTASAVIEARRFGCTHAVMLVHSFSQSLEWFEDFAAFAGLYGGAIETDRVAHATILDGLPLTLGWVRGDAAWLVR